MTKPDIKVVGRTYLYAMLHLIGRVLFIPMVFLFSIILIINQVLRIVKTDVKMGVYKS